MGVIISNGELVKYTEEYGVTSITLPNSVTSIGASAFCDCKSLTTITIPDSVTSIGYSAFYGCTNLTSITIPESMTKIGNSAFSGCTSLRACLVSPHARLFGKFCRLLR